jgi:hypothetical protein
VVEDLLRGRDALAGDLRLRRPRRLLIDDLAAQLDALVADVNGARTGDQALDLILVLSTEGAVVLDARGASTVGHECLFL